MDALTARPGEGGTFLYRLGRAMARRRRVVLAVWALLIAAGLVFVPRFVSSLSQDGFWVPGSQSSRAAGLLASRLPATGRTQEILVFSSPRLTARDERFRRTETRAAGLVSKISGVRDVELPAGPDAGDLTAPGGHAALAVVALSGGEGQAEHIAPRLEAAAARASGQGVRVRVTGEPSLARDLIGAEDTDVARDDAVGLPVALVVLLAVFGSLIAAGLPVLLALGGLGIALGALGAWTLAAGSGFNFATESLTVLLGLGVGLDYALFIVTRFREELAAGLGPDAAAAAATGTAGRTVAVSGSTVAVSLLPLLLVDDPMMRQVVIGPVLAVAVLVAAAVTLLPAVLASLGPAVNRLAPPLPRRRRAPDAGRPGCRNRSDTSVLTRLALRRPVGVLLILVAVLAALAVPALGLRTGLDYGLGSLAGTPAGHADSEISASFSPGAIAPVEVVFTTPSRTLSPAALRAIAALGARLSHDPRAASAVSLPGALGGPAPAAAALQAARSRPAPAAPLATMISSTRSGTVTLMTVTPRGAFDSASAAALVKDIRAGLPAALRGTGVTALVGGTSADIIDLNAELTAKTPLVAGLILLAALLLLAFAFRSALVALIGLAGTLVSVGATYGALVLVFQDGWGHRLLGFHPAGYIQDWLPLFLFAILVGLSTDYQVFLISRIREERERGSDAQRAIATGLARSGPVILSAAAVMVVVFASFMLSTVLELKETGFAFALVVLIDAALTRRLLIPAALRMVGERAWRRPAPGRGPLR